jgi:hypothetical protein
MIGRPSRRLGVCEKNYCGTVEIQSPARLGLEENTAQDAQKAVQQGRSERRGDGVRFGTLSF